MEKEMQQLVDVEGGEKSKSGYVRAGDGGLAGSRSGEELLGRGGKDWERYEEEKEPSQDVDECARSEGSSTIRIEMFEGGQGDGAGGAADEASTARSRLALLGARLKAGMPARAPEQASGTENGQDATDAGEGEEPAEAARRKSDVRRALQSKLKAMFSPKKDALLEEEKREDDEAGGRKEEGDGDGGSEKQGSQRSKKGSTRGSHTSKKSKKSAGGSSRSRRRKEETDGKTAEPAAAGPPPTSTEGEARQDPIRALLATHLGSKFRRRTSTPAPAADSQQQQEEAKSQSQHSTPAAAIAIKKVEEEEEQRSQARPTVQEEKEPTEPASSHGK